MKQNIETKEPQVKNPVAFYFIGTVLLFRIDALHC